MINKIFKSIFIIVFVFTLFVHKIVRAQTHDSVENNIQKIESYLNHANTHFWLGRYWKNSLKEFQIANKYVDSAESILKNNNIDSLSFKSFKLRLLNFKNEIAITEDICVDNMNGRFPLFMSLMGEINNFEFIDEPLEIACENAIDELLNLNTIKPSKPLKDLMTYVVLEINPYDPTIEEVCAQYINNNSVNYVISRHELSLILNENKDYFNKNDYLRISKFFNVNSIGKYSINIVDQVDKINYVNASFDYFNPQGKQIISQTVGESLVLDKVGVRLKALLNAVLYPFFLFAILSLLFNILFSRIYINKKWTSLRDNISLLLSTIVGLAIASVTSVCLFMLLDLYSPSPDDFFKSIQSKLWIISTPFLIGCLSPIIAVLFVGLIFKKRILGEKPLIIAFLQGSFIGSLFPILFHYYIMNEVSSSLNVFLIFSTFATFSAVLSGLSYFNYEINPGSKKYLVFSVLYTFPLIIFNLFLIKNQDLINLDQICYLILSYVPIILLERYWRKIYNIFSSVKKEDINTKPGKIGDLDKLINATISTEETGTRVDFKSNIRNQLLNAVKSTYDQPQVGFQKESEKINVLYIKGPQGIGKSTLLEKELSKKYEDTYFYGDCDEFQDGNTVPYEPFVQAFGDVVGEGVFLSGDRNAKMVLNKLKPGIEETPIGSLALSMIDTNSFAGASVKEICKVFEIFITEKVNSLNSRKPLFFVLEDTHWMDKETYDLLLEFLKMIRILKKRLKFDFILIITERVSEQEPRLGNKEYDEFLNELKAEQYYNFNNLFNVSDDGSSFVGDDFCEKFLVDCEIDINFKTRQKISDGFKSLGFNNPGHILESLKYIISHNWFTEKNGDLFLKEEADFKNIPLPSQLKEMFAEKFSMLDDELKRILETASFIGETFEANILSEIWKVDRLVLLHKLRIAEDYGFVKDLSDKDDVYKFSSKSIMSELRKYASKGNTLDQKPQLVKEYHRIIADIMLNKKQIDPNTFDINIVSQLADRTFFNRDQMPEDAFRLNYITAKRSLNKVNTKHAIEYIKRLKVLIETENIPLKDRIKTLILKQKVYLVDLSSGNFQEALQNTKNLKQLFNKLDINDEEFMSLYEVYYIDQLQLYFDSLIHFNSQEFKIKKPSHEAEIELLCNSENLKVISDKIIFTQRFYYVETFLFKEIEKAKSALEILKIDIESHNSKNNRIYGRVLNSLANIYQRLGIDPEKSKALWIKRLMLVLEESNIVINDESDISIFRKVSKNYSSLIFDLKKDVLYSTGAYSRFIFTNDKNYELALELSKLVKNMNLIAGDYRGLSTASGFISMCYNQLYRQTNDKDLFEKAFYFNEEVYYELENGYITTNGKGNSIDSISQFIVFVNWIELLNMKENISDNMRKSLSNAVDDFVKIFADANSEVLIPNLAFLKTYFEKFNEYSKSNNFEELQLLFKTVKITSINKKN